MLVLKYLPANSGDIRDAGSVTGSGRSPGGGHGNLLWYSCLENLMDRGAWWATVHRVPKSQRWLKQLSTHASPKRCLQVWLLIPVPWGWTPRCLSVLKSRSHCLFLQNSYCIGVQCACFSKDDKYVYAGLKDRSIIVWSVLDGESFCFEGRTELRSGDKRPCSGSLPLEGSVLTSSHWVHLLGW